MDSASELHVDETRIPWCGHCTPAIIIYHTVEVMDETSCGIAYMYVGIHRDHRIGFCQKSNLIYITSAFNSTTLSPHFFMCHFRTINCASLSLTHFTTHHFSAFQKLRLTPLLFHRSSTVPGLTFIPSSCKAATNSVDRGRRTFTVSPPGPMAVSNTAFPLGPIAFSSARCSSISETLTSRCTYCGFVPGGKMAVP